MAIQKPDPILAKEQLEGLQTIYKACGAKEFCKNMFWILTKMPTGVPGVDRSRTVPFHFNRVQTHLFNNLARNNRVLKARQAGLTTFMLLVRLFMPIILEAGKTGMLISQNSKYATLHFQIAIRALRHIGNISLTDQSRNKVGNQLRAHLLHTAYSNRKELVFDMLDSKLIIESAEVEEAGQGVTLHHVVASEVARWPGDPEATTSNIKGGLVPDGTYDEETTGNGAAGYFYEQYLRSMDDEILADARPHFYNWGWSDEYSLDVAPDEKEKLIAELTEEEFALIRMFQAQLDEYMPIAA